MHISIFSTIILIVFLASSCSEEEPDTEQPVIDLTGADVFPNNCDTIKFGHTARVKMLFSDNTELGSFNIEIHQNFDHHSHSTEVEDCALSPKKQPVNPYRLIQDYGIPDGLQEYTAFVDIIIPAGNSIGKFDEGDYHFFISLTDKQGWSTQKGLSIKMLH